MTEKRIAILIDAENIDPTYASQVFSYASSLGTPTVREIFGAGIALNEWVEPIMEYDIIPHITLKPNKYKNSSDISLVLGAADVLLNNVQHPESACDIVIIVSSDCDFSPLAARLRREGIKVIGMGESGSVNPIWPKACTEFVALEAQGPLMRQRYDPAPEPPTTVVQLEIVSDEEEESAPPAAPVVVRPQVSTTAALSHQARVDNIRRFICADIDSHGGKIIAAELFKDLSFDADYRYDQRGSGRKPIDYLKAFYSSWFDIENDGKGGYWISRCDPLAPVRVWHSEAPTPPSPAPSFEPTAVPISDEQLPTVSTNDELDTPPEADVDLPAEQSSVLTSDVVSPPVEDSDANVGVVDAPSVEATDDVPAVSSTPIFKAGLPYTTAKTLRELGFRTIEEFLNATESDFSKIKNLTGKKRKRLMRMQSEMKNKLVSAAETVSCSTVEEAEPTELLVPSPTEGEPPSDQTVEDEAVDTADKPVDVSVRELTLSRLPPLDTLLEKGGVPHRAAMTLRKYGVKTLGDLLNLTEEAIGQFSGVPAQRKEKILQLHAELKERYSASTQATQPERKVVDEPITPPNPMAVSELKARDEESNLFRYLAEHDVPMDALSRILFIVRTSSNGRIVYNELRKAFGNNTANKYMRLLREYRAALDQ